MRVFRIYQEERGITLLELTVVSAILAVLAGIISLSVSGRGTEGRATAKVSDEGTIQQAVDRYSGEHPGGLFPTLNGCLADRILDLVTLACVTPGAESNPGQVGADNLQFDIDESMIGLDLNQDTDTDDSFTVIPIIWNKAYRTVEAFSDQSKVKRFLGDFVPRPPKHAFQFVAGLDVGWRDGENTDPNGLGNNPADSSLITAPEGIGSGDNKINVSTTQVPVWVLGVFDLNSGVEAKALLTNTAY